MDWQSKLYGLCAREVARPFQTVERSRPGFLPCDGGSIGVVRPFAPLGTKTNARMKLFTLCTVGLALLATGCDSAPNAPEFSVEFVSPTPDGVVSVGEPLNLRMEIVSELDIRDFDLYLAVAGGGSTYLAEGLPIRQADGLRRFRIDTTLSMPNLATDASEGRLFFITPSGSRNRMASARVELR